MRLHPPQRDSKWVRAFRSQRGLSRAQTWSGHCSDTCHGSLLPSR
jgi:hypothetical protein